MQQASEEGMGVGGVTLSQVQLRLVEDDLSMLQEFSENLTLQCTRVGKTCKIRFYDDGEHFYGLIIVCRAPDGSPSQGREEGKIK